MLPEINEIYAEVRVLAGEHVILMLYANIPQAGA